MNRSCCDSDDKLLLSAICKGDSRAFDCLFRKYYADLVMFCGRFLRRKEDCEDVVQSVFLILWKSRAKMNDVLNIKQWLLRSTQNSCLNKLNHQTVVQRYSADYLLLMPYFSEDYSSNTLLYSDLVKLVSSAEATLGEKEAEVWSMSRHKGMKYAEIAAALGISVRTVEDRIARAKNHFRRTLDRYWSTVLFLFLFMD